MRNVASVVGMIAVLGVLASGSPVSAEPLDGPKMFTKLGRGFVNAVTGWVELPKRIHETTKSSGAASGFSVGILRGLAYGWVRTMAGLYEVVTFPSPTPSGYVSVVEPEYVFSVETAESSY